jgi:hypothetical protein
MAARLQTTRVDGVSPLGYLLAVKLDPARAA